MSCAVQPAGEGYPPYRALHALFGVVAELRRSTHPRTTTATTTPTASVQAQRIESAAPLLEALSIEITPETIGEPESADGAHARSDGLHGVPAADGAPDPDRRPVEEEHARSWQLVERAQHGDGEAFGKLYDHYVDTVYRFVFFRVNDRTLAEDITSETFLRALRRIGSFSYQGRDIGAWFVTIARNIVLDHAKSARTRLEFSTADTIETRESQPSTEAAVLASLDSQQLMRAVHQLGDEQRECVLLRFVHGMSVSETARIMGKKDGAVKALQHRAIRRLAGLMEGELAPG